jgi:hypothetical protein
VSRRAILDTGENEISIVCLDCGARSYSPGDIEHGFCAACARDGNQADYFDRIACETFAWSPGLSHMATPKIRHLMGLEARLWPPPTRWERLRCALMHHRQEIQTRAVVLRDLGVITWWGVPRDLFPHEMLSLQGVAPDNYGILRVGFLCCSICGQINHPATERKRRAVEEALRAVPG